MSVDLKNHKCVERSLESNCPVCHEYMCKSLYRMCLNPIILKTELRSYKHQSRYVSKLRALYARRVL